MAFNTLHSRLKRRAVIAVLACCAVGYFCYHAFHGDHGIFANKAYTSRVAQLKSDLDGLQTQRQDLERRITLLNADSLDPDMLEERVRDTLNMAHPRDVVIVRR